MNPMTLTRLAATLGAIPAIPAGLAWALGRCVAPALAAARLAKDRRQLD